MSTRREQILNLTTELGSDSAHARQKAALATRASKDTSVDPAALRQQWTERLAANGFGPDELALATTAEPIRVWADGDTVRLDCHLAGSKGVTEQQAIFDRRDVIQAIVDHAGGRLNGDEVEHHADRWLHTAAVIPLSQLDPDRYTTESNIGLGVEGTTYTTPTMVKLEASIYDGYRQGHEVGAATVEGHQIEAAIASWEATTGHQLGDDQVAMVRSICGSGDRFQAVVGPAGSGKTAALEIAARAWESAGFEVVGAAVNGTAAEVLQRSTGVPSRTVAGLVTRLDTTDRPIISERTVVLIDEASTLGNRQHARLVDHVTRAGAAMRTIGDPSQHGAVEAGGMWEHLVAQHAERTPRLTRNRRQSTEEMTDVRMANLDYRSGRIAEAIGRLETNQRIVTAATSGELLDQLTADWYVDRKTSPDSTSRMMAEHHRERRALNNRAQALLSADGTLDGPGTRIGEENFHIGDEVIARAPNRSLHPSQDPKAYVRNGTVGTVIGIDGGPGAETVTVDFKHRGPITVPHDWLTAELRPGITGALTPDYAVTSHAAQGDTYRTGRIVATDTASTEAVYVGLTRGSHDARIYTVRNEPHTIDTDPRLPRIEDPRTEIEVLTDQLSKQRPTELASVANPDIAHVLHLTRRPLQELMNSTDPFATQAQSIVESRIAYISRAAPDPEVVEYLGPRPSDDGLAETWDRGIEAIAIYQARSQTHEVIPSPPSPGTEMARRYDDVTDKVRSAQISSLTEMPTTELATRRAQAVADARSVPTTHLRLLRSDVDKAQASFDSAATRAAAPTTPQPDTDDQGMAAQARAELDAAKARRRDAEVSQQAMTRYERKVQNIDAALTPRIDFAMETPSTYITDTLGDRPTDNSDRWDKAATAIETYRHATLGIEPSAGPLHEVPSIGTKPANPVQAEAWTSVSVLIHGGHDRPLQISR